jgi:hypothetical protein
VTNSSDTASATVPTETASVVRWETDVATARVVFDIGAMVASSDPVRPAIFGVHLNVTEKIWVTRATDSYRMLQMEGRAGGWGLTGADTLTALVPLDLCKRIAKSLPRAKRDAGSPVVVSVENGAMSVWCNGDTVFGVLSTAEFPKTETLWPDETQPVEMGAYWNGEYLADAGKIATALGKVYDTDVLVRQDWVSLLKASTWTFCTTYGNTVYGRYLLMPVRGQR